MKKRHLLIAPIAVAIALVVPIQGTITANATISTNNEIEVPEVTVITPSTENVAENDEKAEIIAEWLEMFENLEKTEDVKNWYLNYLAWCEEIEDPPESIYDYYSKNEIDILFGVVEAEVGDLGGFEERCNVASVIFNRIASEDFGDTIEEVLTADEFATVNNKRYLKVEITEDTILACEFAFAIMDTTDGALYFEGNGSNVHSNYATYLFTDNAGHKFYK